MTKTYESAIRLLSQREHSAYELCEKLLNKGHDKEAVQEALATCQRLGYQSDARYAQQLCRSRINQGYGPVRIQQELHVKRISEELMAEVLSVETDDWVEHARAVWQKKYRGLPAQSYVEQQKHKRFLAYRGFTGDVIAKALQD